MYELEKLSERCWYIKNPANVGVIKLDGSDVCVIDSGSDKEAARKVFKKISEAGWKIRCIINTHSNADHIGGNQFLQNKAQCPALSTDIENAFARNPLMEGSLLWGGYPIDELQNKFLMAKKTELTEDIDKALPEGLEVIKLPGHYLDMIGVRTDDGVCFIADSLFSEEIINKYHIFFVYDVQGFLDTLDELEKTDAKMFVPAHAEPSADISGLIAANRAKIHEIAEVIKEICAVPDTYEDILQKLFAHYGLKMDAAQYVLVGSTLRSYLSYLHHSGSLDFDFEDNRMLWHTVSK